MLPGIAPIVLAATIVLMGVPALAPWAFRSGWFERSSQTRRTRSRRRPTHGGLVLALAIVAGSAVAGPSAPAFRAVLLTSGIAVVSGAAAERGRGGSWVRRLGVVLVAAAVPLAGVRVELIESRGADAVLTALLVLTLFAGIRSLERSDSTLPSLGTIAALAFLVVAVQTDDPAAPIPAAVVGAGLAMVSQTWPPAAVRIGRIGRLVLASALAVAAIEVDPPTSPGRAAIVPILALAPFGFAAVIPEWDRRLRRRGLPPHVALPLAALPGAVAAARLGTDAMSLVVAAALLLPLTALAVVGMMSPRPAGGRAPRASRPTFQIAGASVAVIGAVLLVVAGVQSLGARRDMDAGRQRAIAGLAAARDGDLERAQAEFAAADRSFAAAARTLDGPALRVGDAIPVVAQNLRSARVLAAVGQDLSGTAVAVADRAGADDLRFVNGRFPVVAAGEVATELDAALTTLLHSTGRLEATDSPVLLPQVRSSIVAVHDEIGEAVDSIEVAARATELLPDMLGARGDRRWIVALLSPSERRGVGGFSGNFAELRTAGGDVDLVEDYSASDLNRATDPTAFAKVLPTVYADQFGGFRVPDRWQNVSVTPDQPTMGEAIAAGWPLLPFGGAVDGVISIDPYGVADLLKLTGSVQIPEWPVPITKDNAARVLLYEEYDVLSPDEIDDFQSSLVHAVVDALTSTTLPAPSKIATTMAPSIAGAHLQMWSPNEPQEALFRRIEADGAVERPEEGDFVQLVTQNGGENKIDWYQRQTLTYRPTVDPTTGSVSATATVKIRNNAPDSGVSDYIIGEEGGPTRPGEDRVHVTLLTPHHLVSAKDAAGKPLAVNLGVQNGLTAITVLLEIPSGESGRVTFELEGHVEPSDGTYLLEVAHRAAVTPDLVKVVVAGADGWKAVTPPKGTALHDEDETWQMEARLRKG